MLCALSVLPLSLFLPSLTAIVRDLRTDYALVALSLGGYAAVAASLEFVTGRCPTGSGGGRSCWRASPCSRLVRSVARWRPISACFSSAG